MIFNTFCYFFAFLVPAAILYRTVRVQHRGIVCVVFGGEFYIYFSLIAVGGYPGAFCLLILKFLHRRNLQRRPSAE